LNGFANSPVRMPHHLAAAVSRVSDRKPFEQLAAVRFGLLSCL
jgi:hypothetical protein